MEKVKEAVNKVTHPKSSSTTTGTHHDAATTGTYQDTTTSGYQSGMTGGTTTAGPHNSNLANKADPRVDSDLDGSRTMGSSNYGTGTAGTTGTGYGTTGTGYGSTGTGYGSTTGATSTAGPHSSNLANKADPRVDSDLDNSRTMGSSNYGMGAAGTTGTGYGSTGTGYGSTGTGYGSTTGATSTAGPHSSNLANKADPRVDSDLDGSRTVGGSSYGTGATGTTGYSNTGVSTTAGPHSSNLLNKADPRVDSDADGSRNFGAAQYGAGAHNTATATPGYSQTSGPAPTTDGPHRSDMMNKMDPRVDSDRDGAHMGAQHSAAGHHHHHHGGHHGGHHHDAYATTGTTTTTGKPSLMDKLNPKKDADHDGKPGFMD